LPIPSAIPRCDRPAAVVERREQLLGSSAHQLVGHFGTFGSEVAPMLTAALTSLMEHGAGIRAVCVGSGSDAFVRSLDDAAPTLRGRAIATGRMSARDAAVVLSSCDLLLQPYPDGVTTRRTSTMAGLVNARAIVTTTGHLTEPVWAETGAVALAGARDKGSLVRVAQALLSDEKKREALAARGEQVYLERFALAHTIRTLRSALVSTACD
jgi:glycosyltransferase involved in cell wall biosynthesis